jgi:hypothetical protein
MKLSVSSLHARVVSQPYGYDAAQNEGLDGLNRSTTPANSGRLMRYGDILLQHKG